MLMFFRRLHEIDKLNQAGGTASSGSEAILRGVKNVVAFPGVTNLPHNAAYP
jgi:hypothetical protein